jgi:SAM-dependent methyltransferase
VGDKVKQGGADNFSGLADVFEAQVDWPKRLANEEPFYRWLFERVGNAKRVLDVACGTGHHAAIFNRWGLRVEGADLSPAMIERCRARWGESDSLRWSVRGYDAQNEPSESFDVAICVGNSMALAGDVETVHRAIAQLLRAVRPGGAVVVHVLNLWKLPDGEPVWQKCLRAKLPQGESLIIKGVHRSGSRGFVDVLVTGLATDPPKLKSECAPFLGLEAIELGAFARQNGAGAPEFFGDYARRPYDRASSQDLIMVAMRS